MPEFTAPDRIDCAAVPRSILSAQYGALLAALPQLLDGSPPHLPFDRRAEMLAGLPALLEVARAILLVGFGPGDHRASELRRRIEACVDEADRLLRGTEVNQRNTSDGARPQRGSWWTRRSCP
jgi:hypothetical protein